MTRTLLIVVAGVSILLIAAEVSASLVAPDRAILYFTGALTAFTLAYAVFAALQWMAIERQAEIAEQMLSNTEIQLRAHLSPGSPDPSFVYIPHMTSVHVEFVVRNNGLTPARKIAQMKPSLLAVEEPQMAGRISRPSDSVEEGTIDRDGAFLFAFDVPPPSDILVGRFCYLRGYVLYTDVFGREHYYEYVMKVGVAPRPAGEYPSITHNYMRFDGD